MKINKVTVLFRNVEREWCAVCDLCFWEHLHDAHGSLCVWMADVKQWLAENVLHLNEEKQNVSCFGILSCLVLVLWLQCWDQLSRSWAESSFFQLRPKWNSFLITPTLRRPFVLLLSRQSMTAVHFMFVFSPVFPSRTCAERCCSSFN